MGLALHMDLYVLYVHPYCVVLPQYYYFSSVVFGRYSILHASVSGKNKVALNPNRHILVFVMKTTTRKATEVTFHVTIKEMIHNFLVSFEDIVNDTAYEDIQSPLSTVDILADLRSDDLIKIRKVFREGASVILVPDISKVCDEAYIMVHITLSNGNIIYILHEDINY